MKDYFARLTATTPTRVWVNNPTAVEVGLAQGRGAVGCTTNPGFGGNLARRAPDEVLPDVRALLADHPAISDPDVADLLQERLVARIATAFLPLHESSRGAWGYVSIQGPPERDVDAGCIWDDAVAARQLGPNVAPKIPATVPGLDAFEHVVQEGWPVIVTEVFSVDQLVAACERYEAVTARTGVRPPFFLSPITGIFGDHLRKVAARDGIEVPAQAINLAGIGLARRCAAIVAERAWSVTLLFGGARIAEDLTGLVGERHCATVNWSTFEEIEAIDPAIEHTIDRPLDPVIERALLQAFPDVLRAWTAGALEPEEFEAFPPVQHFREVFIAGRRTVTDLVADQRRGVGAEAAAPS
jgi:transaldolase